MQDILFQDLSVWLKMFVSYSLLQLFLQKFQLAKIAKLVYLPSVKFLYTTVKNLYTFYNG